MGTIIIRNSLLLSLILLLATEAMGQNGECYTTLLKRGIEEFNKGNIADAILKWQTAKDNCPDITSMEKKQLQNWIFKARHKQATLVGKPKALSPYSKSAAKRDTVYIVKPVTKIVYVEKPVERTVYVDKPEPYHRYGKGNGRLLIYSTCSNTDTLKIWIDGEYCGIISGYYKSEISCDNQDMSGALLREVLSGKHHIQTQNVSGATLNYYIIVHEDQCQRSDITCN